MSGFPWLETGIIVSITVSVSSAAYVFGSLSRLTQDTKEQVDRLSATIEELRRADSDLVKEVYRLALEAAKGDQHGRTPGS